jgi:RNA polymerase sigma factor (sigma-70 family)
VFGFCLSRLGSREEAEDAVQSTFLNAHRALQRGVLPDSELAWLLKIAHNVCLTRRRSTRRRGRVEAAHDLDSMQDYLPAQQQEPADELIRLTDALEHLPENQRRAILLREWQGLSYSEIARELKVTQSAVETLIFRARRALAANLEMVVVKPRLLARARHVLDLGWLVAALRTLLEGGVAAKAATAAVAVSTAAVIATSPPVPTQRASDAEHARPALATTDLSSTPAVLTERPRLRGYSEPVSVERAARRAQSNAAAPATVTDKPRASKKADAKVKPERRAAVANEKKARPEKKVTPVAPRTKHTRSAVVRKAKTTRKPTRRAEPQRTSAPAPAHKAKAAALAQGSKPEPAQPSEAPEPTAEHGKTK